MKKSNAEDFEIWTFVGAGTEWKSMEFGLSNANFFVPENGHFLNFTQLSLDFVSKNSFSFGAAYKQEYVKFPQYTRAEYRPMLHLFYTKEFGAFEFRDRNRWEFRIIDGELVNRYRNQLQLAYLKLKAFTPYLSTEFFFYVKQLDYARQRTLLGIDIPVKSVNINLFGGYQVNEDAPDQWGERYLLGTSLNYTF